MLEPIISDDSVISKFLKFFSVSSDSWIEVGGGVLEVDEIIDVVGIAVFDFKTTTTNVGDACA